MKPEHFSLFFLLFQFLFTFSFSQYISIETQRHCTSAPSPQISFTQFLLSNTSSYSSIPITNYWNIQYYGPIYVGSAKEKLTVVYDTGSNLYGYHPRFALTAVLIQRNTMPKCQLQLGSQTKRKILLMV